MLLALALAVLGAIGLDALVHPARERLAVQWAAGSFTVLLVIVAGLALAAQLDLAGSIQQHQSRLIWPAVEAVVGLAITGFWLWSPRSGAHMSTRGVRNRRSCARCSSPWRRPSCSVRGSPTGR